MRKLIILLDLWGNKKSDWVVNYSVILQTYFEIEFYDCCELGQIDLTDYSEDKLHLQFINGGIDRAIETLLEKEKGIVNVLGFSIGGYIAWRASNEGLLIKNLTAISSTKLRYESIRPECTVQLLYGENDKYIPKNDWFSRIGLDKEIYKGEEHDFYTKREIAIDISNEIIRKRKPNR